jgi:hypothetical protein
MKRLSKLRKILLLSRLLWMDNSLTNLSDGSEVEICNNFFSAFPLAPCPTDRKGHFVEY